MADLSPTVRQRELGLRLRELRTAKNLTVEMVAKELLCSPTKISRAETGVRRATLRDVRDLCRIYEVDSETSAELMELARDAYKPGWWNKYDDLKVTPLIGMEQSATAITSFGMYFFPALLQSADYARAVVKGVAPKIAEKILDQRVEARMERQRLLQGPTPPKYRVLLDEAVLRRHIGGPVVMRANSTVFSRSYGKKRRRSRSSLTRSGPTAPATATSPIWNSAAPSSQISCSSRPWSASYT